MLSPRGLKERLVGDPPGRAPSCQTRADVARTLSGNLDTFSLADLLQWLEINALSGRVTVWRGEVLRTIDLKGGAIVFVSSSLPNERLGVYLTRRKVLSESSVYELLAESFATRQEPHAPHPRTQPAQPREARGGRRGPRDEDPPRPLPLGGRLVRVRSALQDRGPHPDPSVSPRAGSRVPRRQVGGRLARESGSGRRRRRDRRPLGEGVQARRARGPVLDDPRGPSRRSARARRPARGVPGLHVLREPRPQTAARARAPLPDLRRHRDDAENGPRRERRPRAHRADRGSRPVPDDRPPLPRELPSHGTEGAHRHGPGSGPGRGRAGDPAIHRAPRGRRVSQGAVRREDGASREARGAVHRGGRLAPRRGPRLRAGGRLYARPPRASRQLRASQAVDLRGFSSRSDPRGRPLALPGGRGPRAGPEVESPADGRGRPRLERAGHRREARSPNS